MISKRFILPWCLLTISLAAHVWLFTRPSPRSDLPALTVASAPPLATYIRPAPKLLIAATSSAASLPSAQPAAALVTAAHAATFTAYADILASSLETQEQHADMARLLGRWIATDPGSASAWLNRQPDDPRYDLPVAQVATLLTVQGDYALAREWADSIRTPEVRAAAIEEILAEQYRHRLLTPTALATAAAAAAIPAHRVQGILNYSRLD